MALPYNFRNPYEIRGRHPLALLVLVTMVFQGHQVRAQNPIERGALRPRIETTQDEPEGGSRPVGKVASLRPDGAKRPPLRVAGRPENKVSLAGKLKPARSRGSRPEPSTKAAATVRPKAAPARISPAAGEPAGSMDSAATAASLESLPQTWAVTVPPIRVPASDADQLISKFLNPRSAVQLKLEDWQAALAQDEEAIQKDPGNKGLKARALFMRGQIAYQQGDLTVSLVAFNEAARVQPDLLLGHLGAGNVYLANRLIPQAINSFQAVTRLNPRLALAYKSMGDAYFYSQRNREAATMYQRARDLDYSGVDLTVALVTNQAQILITERRWRQALFTLHSIVERSPSADLYLMLGQCYEEIDQKMSAAQSYFKATALDRHSAVAHYRLGSLLFQKHEYQAAWDELERAIALDPAGTRIDLRQAREKRQKLAEKLRL